LDTLSGMTPKLITEAEIESARAAIDPVFLNSPLLRESPLDAALGCALLLKVETLNPIRSFKGRGTEALFAALKQKPRAVSRPRPAISARVSRARRPGVASRRPAWRPTAPIR
jgi:threonine dehydratase